MKKYLFPRSNLPETMVVVLIVWLCSLALIGLVVTPLFGARVAGVVSVALLLALIAICWGICAYGFFRRDQHLSARSSSRYRPEA